MGYNTAGLFRSSHAGRSSRAMGVTFQNGKQVTRIMADLEEQLEVYGYYKDGTPKTRSKPNAELRQAAKDIAQDVVVPQVVRAARSSRTPQAKAVATTAKAKSDRLVMVQIGQAIPPLSGFRRFRRSAKGTPDTARDNTRWKTSVAWGSELGPHPDSDRNHYKAPRVAGGYKSETSGYWVRPGVQNSMKEAVKRFEEALDRIVSTYSRYR
jgi:hypothetical protein